MDHCKHISDLIRFTHEQRKKSAKIANKVCQTD